MIMRTDSEKNMGKYVGRWVGNRRREERERMDQRRVGGQGETHRHYVNQAVPIQTQFYWPERSNIGNGPEACWWTGRDAQALCKPSCPRPDPVLLA